MRSTFKLLFLLLFAFTMWAGNTEAQEGFGLQLIKDGTPVAEANGPMNYTLVVFNNSVDECEAPDCTVVLTDVLPTDFIFQSVVATKFFSIDPPVDITPDCSHNNGTNTLTCDLGEFEVVQGCGFFCIEFPTPFVEISIVGLAPPSLGTITNNAMVEAQGPGGLDPDTASFDTNVVGSFPQPDLVISKADAVDPVIGGTTAFYNITVFNAGNAPATNAFIRDIIPPGGIYNDGLSTPSCVEMPPASNRVTCPLGAPIPPGGFRMRTIAVDIGNPPVPAVIQNIARVASDEPDSDPSSNVTFEPTQVVPAGPIVTESDLVITKTSPDTVIAGQQFSYVVNIFNVGPDAADNVRFRDAPFNNTLIDILGIMSNQPVICAPGMMAPNFRCDLLNPLPAGQSVSFIIPATYVGPLPFAPDPTPIFNVANAILGPSDSPNTVQVDPVPGNNTFVEVTDVLPPQPEVTISDLVITKNAPDIIIPNEQFGYFIQLVNLGPDTAQNVIVRDIIPGDVTFDTLPAGCSIIVNVPPVEDIMRCNVGDLETGEEIILAWRATYTGVVPSLPLFRPVFNLADVDFGPVRALPPGIVQIDPETSNNTSVAVSRAIEPPPNINLVDLFVVKVDSPDPVVTEETLTYTLFVYNFGPDDAVDVIVTDILPAGVMVTNDGGCGQIGQTLTCNIPLIMAGTSAIIQIEVDAPALMDDEPIMILNAARADVNPFALLESENTIQLDFAPSNNADSEKTTVVPVPPPLSDLLILKTDTPDPVIEDEVLTYTIFVKNTGPDPAFGVLVSDWLPQEGLDLDTVEFSFSPNVADCIQNPDFPMFDEPYKVEC